MADYSQPETAEDRERKRLHREKLERYGLKEHYASYGNYNYSCVQCDAQVHSLSGLHAMWHRAVGVTLRKVE